MVNLTDPLIKLMTNGMEWYAPKYYRYQSHTSINTVKPKIALGIEFKKLVQTYSRTYVWTYKVEPQFDFKL